MEYNIRLEFAEEITDASVDRTMNAFEQFHPAVSRSTLGRLEVWITILAEDAGAAALTGYRLAYPLGRRVLALEVMETADFDRLNGLVPTPELVNATEAGEILGISTAAVGQKFTAGELPGQRVGDRTLVFARRDIEAIAAERAKKAIKYEPTLGISYSAET